MRINGSSASFYNASSRVNQVSQETKIQNTQVASEVNSSSQSNISSDISNNQYQGVKQTRVSSENAYQKAMLNDPRFAMERMASKLMDKLPNILNDMKNLSDSGQTAATDNNNSSAMAGKIVINENSNVNYQNSAMELQDISL